MNKLRCEDRMSLHASTVCVCMCVCVCVCILSGCTIMTERRVPYGWSVSGIGVALQVYDPVWYCKVPVYITHSRSHFAGYPENVSLLVWSL